MSPRAVPTALWHLMQNDAERPPGRNAFPVSRFPRRRSLRDADFRYPLDTLSFTVALTVAPQICSSTRAGAFASRSRMRSTFSSSVTCSRFLTFP